jgi:hypothetical protein
MARPIHHFLKEFASGEEMASAPPPSQVPVKKPQSAAPAAATAPPPDMMASRLQDSYQQGVAAGRAQERQLIETETLELSIDFERRLEDSKRKFSKALAEQLADEVRNGIERARLSISTHVAAALVPFMRAGVTQAAVASFVAELSDMVELTEGVAIDVTCPREVAEPLREALGDAMGRRGAPPGSVRCIPGDVAEIRVKINDTVIETRLAEWLSRLDGVLR